ncbi:MAG: UDP-N-acetylglucosamine 1-carboxyvinyltransferase [Candidatus Levybacteria bacterium RIFCSPLOWO2_01_FULL_36_13]|nr:MAG: UDP-N-acetylglucosamine 1-carboxyvinyltransferase [Candidatus Levybacteria bacterium RIFCSPHIGHO2_01_FULL_36_15b]OGH35608.1 MAG: UDP-N-acetylglucosamine 1-carboxyvinyltransferase [Candidatus Levybacteria bacterium RIFCSPLOWO2_01_FULL_36_13]
MEYFEIIGGKKLKGSVSMFGSKNVALKLLVAACLSDKEILIENIPLISDVRIMADIIEQLGGKVIFKDHKLTVKMEKFTSDKISLEKAAEIRTSYMFLAPMLARIGSAIIPNPGGCRIGARPIDRVVEGLKKMGVKIKYLSKDGYFHAEAPSGLKGAYYKFEKSTHTGTETMILAAVLAKGKTVLDNAAQEPEIDELIAFLRRLGARIERKKPRTIVIEGVKNLNSAKFRVFPDRNEVVTFAVASIITQGDIFIKDISEKGLKEFLEMLEQVGGGYEIKNRGIRFYYKGQLRPAAVTTGYYPGFMTDWQGPWAVLMTKANGESVLHERVYENRFTYVDELKKMGADIELFNPPVKNPSKFYNFNISDDNKSFLHAAKIRGSIVLHNAVMDIADLRAGATLVLGAISAEGKSILFGLGYLDRGYEQFEQRLKSLGANIKRIKES